MKVRHVSLFARFFILDGPLINNHTKSFSLSKYHVLILCVLVWVKHYVFLQSNENPLSVHISPPNVMNGTFGLTKLPFWNLMGRRGSRKGPGVRKSNFWPLQVARVCGPPGGTHRGRIPELPHQHRVCCDGGILMRRSCDRHNIPEELDQLAATLNQNQTTPTTGT